MKSKSIERKQRFSLTLLFSLVIFTILLIAVSLAATALAILVHFKVIGGDYGLKLSDVIVFMVVISTLLGTSITFLAIKIPLKPINIIINKMNALAAGKYETRLEYKGAFDAIPGFAEFTESFNKMASELGSTEMLRSDFINNFSHEFKTPIVSISGLARLLKSGDLSDEENQQYIEAIDEEATRLSSMSTNVLNLTKVENQTILSGFVRFNLSEQLRSCLLLLENKWNKKKLELQIELDEYYIEGNEELLRQVWINLIDNAIKFSHRCGSVSVDITEADETLTVTVANTGNDIPSDKIDKIWGKFYQADESHSSEGNGVGLAIVKRIVELHNGNTAVKSENGVTAFSITLPKKQNK